jgi:lambda repressor-like predicted transcriptional regulator
VRWPVARPGVTLKWPLSCRVLRRLLSIRAVTPDQSLSGAVHARGPLRGHYGGAADDGRVVVPVHVDMIVLHMAVLGLTPNGLARASGVGRTTIRRVLSGRRHRLQRESVERLAVALGVSPDVIGSAPPQRGKRQ